MAYQKQEQQLKNLDFGKLIYMPLKAICDSQTYSNKATLDYIKKYGFKGSGAIALDQIGGAIGNLLAGMEGLEAQMIEFEFEKMDPEGRMKPYTLMVPFLTLLPIPTLKISSASVMFNVRTMSTTDSSTDESSESSFSAGGAVDAVFVNAGGSFSYSESKMSRTGYTQTSEFNLSVQVQVVADDTPPGIEKLIDIMMTAVNEQKGWNKPSSETTK